MRKHFLLLFLFATVSVAVQAQSARGVRIGYIDMEYILEKVPNYAEANNQLELKAQKWKQDAEVKRNEITKLKENLKTERVLLTKELIEEREEEITFLETELLDFQQKRFGSTGDLMTQKAVLVKPIQDQVFTIVQDIATAKKYDFIFDKSSDLTMLFAAQQHNISDQVVRQLVRAEKREQLSSKQLKDEAEQERKQDLIDSNPELSERAKANEVKRSEREKMIEDRKAAAETAVEARKQAYAEKRAKLLEEREAKKNGVKAATTGKTETKEAGKTTTEEGKSESGKTVTTEEESVAAPSTTAEEKRAAAEEVKQAAAVERQRKLDERKAALEEKRKKILADREALKKEREEKKNNPVENKTE